MSIIIEMFQKCKCVEENNKLDEIIEHFDETMPTAEVRALAAYERKWSLDSAYDFDQFIQERQHEIEMAQYERQPAYMAGSSVSV